MRRTLSLATLSLCAWGFVELASDVREGDTTDFDRKLMLSLRHPEDLSDPIGSVFTGADGTFEHANDAFVRALGYSRAELADLVTSLRATP